MTLDFLVMEISLVVNFKKINSNTYVGACFQIYWFWKRTQAKKERKKENTRKKRDFLPKDTISPLVFLTSLDLTLTII